MRKRIIYLAGSLRNPAILETAAMLREEGHEVFDDWMAAGEKADDCWQDYEAARARPLYEALNGHHAKHAFSLDKHHLERCDTFILQLPCGKSGHLELGYCVGTGKDCHVLMLQEPDRFDLMYRFAHGIWTDPRTLKVALEMEIHNVEP